MNSTANDRHEHLIDLITLGEIDGIGVKRMHLLIEALGSASAVLGATIGELSDLPHIGRETASNIHEKQNRKKAVKTAEQISQRGWKYFLYPDTDYPESLKHIPDPPPYLFYAGNYTDRDSNAIAVVGSRSASEEGRIFAESLAADLSGNGITVISGMARGVDTAAHRGALTAGGRTIAVFGCSLDIIYPPEGKKLFYQIIESGCVFSEFLPGTPPDRPHFPRRNRLISGLSQGVVVIEAALRSGALSTAGHALIQNREVFAVPGSPRQQTSMGTNRLIKEGATLLISVEDIYSELPRLKGRVNVTRVENIPDITDTEKKVVGLFDEGPIHIDRISRSLNLAVPELMQILLALELKGIIRELSGKRYILN
nr:DNA-processing protein DprA [candidate division Zixibacteria bacterium]